MTQAPLHVSLNGSRLIRYLSDLAVSSVDVSHKQFAEKLGQLINFSDSITLLAVHGDLPSIAFEPTEASADKVRDEFLRVRAGLVKSVVKSFAPGAGPSTIKLPLPKSNASIEEQTTFDPYHRFYTKHQREMDYKIQGLQLYIRDGVSGLSRELAQLSTLDAALGDVLAVHTRKFFLVIPKLIGKRFEFLYKEHKASLEGDKNALAEDEPAKWILPGGWLEQFYKEMQGLLLAELDVRLQPVLGLVEALNEQVKN